jgi:phosphopentomutase
MRRCILIVLDSVGIGELPDAPRFGDAGADTLGHICEVRGLSVPHMAALGLGNIARATPLKGVAPAAAPTGCYGRMAEVSDGKDTTTGHWEMMGIEMAEPFTTFPNGFPDALIQAFCERAGVDGVLCNQPASGTEVIKDFGPEHLRTRKPIFYTSADPVLQIAAHEGLVPIEELYRWCEAAFEVAAPYGISRVIARPFEGELPYARTHRRHDFAVAPPTVSALEKLTGAGLTVTGVGKIPQIYAERGVSAGVHTVNNDDGFNQTLALLATHGPGLIFTNLVDFDMLYGHRRDVQGYGDCLEAFDRRLPELLAALRDDDWLIITADHGNDPTYRGTDHTREYVPLLVYGPRLAAGVSLGTRATFADIGESIAASLGVSGVGVGSSFWESLQPTPHAEGPQ